jgi:transposase
LPIAPLVSDDLWEAIAPLLPGEPPKPKRGRPRCDDRLALAGIIFVLRSGIPWEMLPREFGCSGMTCWRRLRDWQTAGVWARLHRVLLERLSEAGQLDWSRASLDSAAVPAKRGRRNRREPDGSRAKPGTKRHLVVDRKGTPLGVRLSPANRHDSMMRVPSLDAMPRRAPWPRSSSQAPRQASRRQGLDHHRCRAECRTRAITPRSARRRVDSSERRGRHRRVVERTLAWLNRFRRLAIGLMSGAPTSTRLS